MQKFSVADGGNPDGTAKDRVGAIAGTKYFAKYYNDNIFNLIKFVESSGYTLIDDDLSQLAKASRGLYDANFTYNTSVIATQTVNDVVLCSDGVYYEAQADGINGDNPVGSVTGNWKIFLNNKLDGNIVHNITVDNDYTLTAIQNQYGRIEVTDSGVVLTGTINIIMNNDEHTFLFVNSTAQDLTVKTSTGTGITVLAGEVKQLRNDETNVISYEAGAGVDIRLNLADEDYPGQSAGVEILKSNGDFIKNQCTAWVNFDGTTTPPTIRDSFNVNDVVRTATGLFEIHFEVAMDNISYIGAANNCNFNTQDSDNLGRVINCIASTTLIMFVQTGNISPTLQNHQFSNVQIFGGKN